jgi:hypothetical protein
MSNENDSPETKVTHIDPLPKLEEFTRDSIPVENLEEPVITDDDVQDSVQEPEVTEVVPEETITENNDTQKSDAKKSTKKYKVSYQFSSKVSKWNPEAVTISLPPNLETETKEILDKIPNIDLSGTDETANWGATLSNGMDNIADLNQFVETLNNPEADFRQSVDYKGKELGITDIKTNFATGPLTGEKAILAFNKALGIGDLIQVPLWTTGIWVTLKTPTEAEMIRLNQELAEDKINQGRATKGLVYSNAMVYTIDRLSRFVIDHIYDTTLQVSALESKDIREIIKTQDYPTLLWGLICAMYPRGFQYSRSCISDPEKCNYVLEELLNPKKLLWVNYRALTETHMVHMAQKQHKIKSLESVMNYQSTLAAIADKTVIIGSDSDSPVKVTLKTPNLNEYISIGEEWVNSIVKIIDTIVSKPSTDADYNKERNKLIERYSQSSSLRQISHWIKSVEINDYIVEDTDTLGNILTIMSQDDVKRTELIENVSKYIDESTISVIGVPVYDCPKCKVTQTVENATEEFKNIIPLDVTTIFFDQHVQRMMRIGQR